MNLLRAISLLAVTLLAWPQADLRVDVNLVRVLCVVTDATGAPVRGLRREDFAVTDDGVPQEVRYLWQEADLPLTVGLVADVSGSEYRFIDQHRQTLLQFLSRILSPNDRAFLVTVEHQQRLVTDLTGSVETLGAGAQEIDRRTFPILGEPCTGERRRACSLPGCAHGPGPAGAPCGGTALWNGVFFAARLKLQPQSGRKALLLLTDGWDTGSDHTPADAIEASQGADAAVYSVRYVDPLWPKPSPLNHIGFNGLAGELQKAKHNLERITRETGGLAFEGEADKLPEIFDRIETDLRSQYVLGYTQPSARLRRGYHKLAVKVARSGVKVRSQDGYYTQ